jgi:NAD(P)H-hydrate epimerase
MIPVLSRAQIRAYDADAIERCGVPGIVLMENAGRGAAERIVQLLEELPSNEAIVIVCGPGNNGGDGLVVARHLRARGLTVRVFLVGDAGRMAADAKTNLYAWRGLGGEVQSIDDDVSALRSAVEKAPLAVDALFGTGLARDVSGVFAEVVEVLTECRCDTVALDIPSGIDADTGHVLGVAIRARHTLSFGHLKTGLLQGAGFLHAGTIQCVNLGIFDESVVAQVGHRAQIIEPRDVARAIGERAIDTHKYQAGHILLLAGSAGKLGAATLAAQGALRAGAGLLTLASWPDCRGAFSELPPEVMTAVIDPDDLAGSLEEMLDKKSAIAIGPGLGLNADARKLVDEIVLRSSLPVVVDADAITHFAGRADALRDAAGPRILTPHAGELARLLDIPASQLEADRLSAAERAATQSASIIVYKGPHTIIASPDEKSRICDRGNALLATSGSGDVLTGIIAALLHNASPLDAACAGVFLHARTADHWRAALRADRGMMASDIITGLPTAIAALPSRLDEAGTPSS